MQAHEERVVNEKRDLDEKLEKLDAFCFSPGSQIFRNLPLEDQRLLESQFSVMKVYSEILGKRIARFPKGENA